MGIFKIQRILESDVQNPKTKTGHLPTPDYDD
jgi:hypothetical protein